jgi:Mg-chelatase subunit ChlD
MMAVLTLLAAGCGREDAPAAPLPPRQPGIALVVLVDTSGSMRDAVPAAGGGTSPKIAIARKAVLGLVSRAEAFARANPERTVRLAIREFSTRPPQQLCRPVVEMGAPDLAAARGPVEAMMPEGGTPIGEAMRAAQRELDQAGLASSHLIVVTDGENTDGPGPGEVARELARQPIERRPSIYFVAFDVAAAVFSPVQQAGGLVLPAANERELSDTLDVILGEKVLVEKAR